ncbi:hypothetical protein JCM19045_1342 [Bacillus sp. JCM 19045]|nr:hypothetical protein JCM19045_1342 [Bacillus sp. JCM 19045]
MEFYVKQRVFSFNDQFTVFDHNQDAVYKVNGKFFSVGNQLAITKTTGDAVLQIKQKVMSFMPRYTISNEEKELCHVVKKMTFFRAKYEIQPMNWTIEGSLFDHQYKVLDGTKEIMSVEKKWLNWGIPIN